MKSGLLISAGALAIATAAQAQTSTPPSSVSNQVVVTAKSSISNLVTLPNTSAGVDAEQLSRTTDVITPEDTLRYLPDVLIRQRHVGDTQSPITTRTSGVGASARSLIYVDGILISSLIGNNNTSASPKWGLVSPDAVERVDVLYGPFAASYAGNSIGSVIAFTTRTPQGLEGGVEAQGAFQSFSKYGDSKTYSTGHFAGDIGNRFGPLTVRLSLNHLDSWAQPLTYATSVAPATTSAAGAVVTGAFNDANRLSQPIVVLGATGIEHQVQDNASGRLTYELTPEVTAAYTFGLFRNHDTSTVNSYLTNAAGQPVYSGAVNIGGRAYTLANSTFSNGVYHLDELQLAQGLSFASHTSGVLDFEFAATNFSYLDSRQRTPSGALPLAFSSGAGTDAVLNGTGWYTLDGNGTWRARGAGGAHIVTFGAHDDSFKLNSVNDALGDWIGASTGAVNSQNKGNTETQALWLQDAWTIDPKLKLTVGGRFEHWRAFNGLNYSASPALNVAQPVLRKDAFSPKAVLAFTPWPDWTFKGSVGVAYRFPTVTELYQSVTVGTQLQTPNPNLLPEQALSSELSAKRSWSTGSVQVSLFDERISKTLLSRTALLPSGATASFIQNVDRTHATDVEIIADQKDMLFKSLELSGWLTFVDAHIDRDAAFPAAVGSQLPQLPRLRASFVATYSPIPKLDLTLAGRYSDRSFATINNVDHYANTYQGFSGFFVADVHARYKLTAHLAAGLGVTNLNNRSYFLFHPFPQRTVVMDLKYTY
jgi:iron complex outermembrane receptor protein